MHRLLYIILLFIITTVRGQSDEKSLKKYSYFLGFAAISSDGLSIKNGTGFFIKNYKGLFLVSAKHVLLDCDNPSELPNRINKKISLLLNNENGSLNYSPVELDLSRLRDTSRCTDFMQEPDAEFLKVNVLTDTLYSLEKLIKRDFNLGDADSIVIYGYPTSNNATKESYTFKESSKIIGSIDSAYRFSYTKNYKGDDIVDSLYSYFSIKHFQVDSSLKGYSGSPVFLKNKVGSWFFAGILCGVSIQANVFIVLKPKHLIKLLEK